MNIGELFIIAVGLSMDAFAVAVCKGLAMKKSNFSQMAAIGLYFGIFQAVMPLGGYFLGNSFSDKIISFGHRVVFALLVMIGAKMIWESLAKYKADESTANSPTAFFVMLPLALATSIDAFAVGVGFAFLKVNITAAVVFIGSITFSLSVAGVKIGNIFGLKYKSKAELAGGIVLILMGIKILLEGLNIINF